MTTDATTPGSEAEAAPPEGVLSADTLRSMDAESDQLAAELDEAREAVHAAHQADSMASPGEELPPGDAVG